MVFLHSIASSLSLLTLIASAARAASVCTVATGGDAATAITTAFSDCANGGTVVFSKGATYNLNSTVSVSGLKGTNVQFYGTLNLPAYDTKYNDLSAFITIKGDSITFDGAGIGTIIGGGQKWWDAANKKAPTVLIITATRSAFSNFNILQSPRYHIVVNSSNGITLDKIFLKTISGNSNLPKNTDAVDVLSSKHVTWTNSVVTNGDDCLSIKGNTSNIFLNNIDCTGSHGFSIGSLGKGGDTDVVSNVVVKNSKCTDCENGVRIKTWAGGKGSVTGITFSNVVLTNATNPILITTHYCDDNQMSYCVGDDSFSLNISDVTFKHITGSILSGSNSIFNVNCSISTPCSDFTVSDINISKSYNTKPNVCTYLSGSSKIPLCSS